MKTTFTMLKHFSLLLLLAIVANLTSLGQNLTTNPDTVCKGTTEFYRVDSTGTPSYYHWIIKNGSGTINHLYPPNDSAAHISVTWANTLGFDTLLVVEYNEFGCNGDTNKLRVERYSQPAPTLSVGPASQCVGTTFTVTASPNAVAAGLTFQWYKNGFPITDSTRASLVIHNIQLTDAGSYTCLVGNICGSVASPARVLSVIYPPTVTLQPLPVSTCLGQNITLSTIFDGSAPVTYQWYLGTTPVSNAVGHISGATNDTLVITGMTYADTGYYHVVATNTCNFSTSQSVHVNINVLPVIATQPVGDSKCEGDNMVFNVTTSDGDSLHYIWRFNGNPITGSPDSPIFSLLNITYANEGNYSVAIYNNCNVVTPVISNNALLNMNALPVITADPVGASLCQGDNVTFTVTSDGEALHYEWLFNGSPITGAPDAAIYTINGIAYANEGNYSVRVYNNCSPTGVTSANALLNMNALPAITTQPVGASLCEGENITFSVVSDGEDLHYQWMKNGNPITGTDSPSYTLNNITYADEATYSVRVYNNCNSTGVVSNGALLNMNALPGIVSQPTGASLCEGDNITFTVGVQGEALHYEWLYNGNPITGAPDAASYSLTNITYANEGNYSVRVYNNCNTAGVVSANALLNMNALPLVTTDPVGASLCEGDNITFTTIADGEALHYEWLFNNVPVSGATDQPSFTLNNITYGNEGNYRVRVYNNCKTEGDTSLNALLNMNALPGITVQPVGASLCETNSITFTVGTIGEDLHYEWRFNGTPITGAPDANTYTIPSLTYANEGNYSVRVYNNCNTTGITSNNALLNMNAIPVITQQPKNISTCVGHSRVFSVIATGEALNYQWYRKDGAIVTLLPGKTSPSLVFSPVSYTDTADYYCEIWNNCLTIQTIVVNLNINIVPTIVVQPRDISSCLGDPELLSVTATGDSLFYQWYRNNAIVPGATSSSLLISPVTLSNTGTYKVVVTNTCDVKTSNEVDLTVNLVPHITDQPNSVSVCPGDPVTFSVTATGDSLFYQWRKNGNLMVGQNGSSLVFPSVGYADTADYQCYVWNTCNHQYSDIVNLNINVAPVITTQPQNLLTCVGDNNQLSVVATGDSLYYQWYKNSVAMTGETGTTLDFVPVTLADIGAYRVDIHNNCSQKQSNTVNLFANIDPTVIVPPHNVSSCLGYTATFTVGIQALGSALPDFQWYKNGVKMTGKTTNTLSIFPVTLADVATYSCELSNNCDTVMTNSARLTVNLVPVMVTQPNDISTCPGNIEEMKVILTGDSLNYRWYKNGNPIANSNSAYLPFNPIGPSDIGTYYCHIWNTCNTAGMNSSTAAITMNIPPTIMSDQVTGGNFCTGQNKVLSIIATGDSIKYEWHKSGNILADSTNPYLRFTPLTLADNGTYYVRAYNNCGEDVSQTASIYVNTIPLITLQPKGISTCDGANVMLEVQATGDNIVYQWKLEGIDIPGANSNTLVLNNLQYSQTGNYSCVLTNSCGITYSNQAPVTINRDPQIVTQPLTQIRCETELITLEVVATGDSLNYQWYKNGVAITGANSSVYEITSALASDGGTYECYIWNTCNDVMSSAAVLTVYHLPDVVTQPVSKTRCEEDTVSFRITATGDLLSYQWYHNNNLIAGATSTTYSIPRISMSDAGTYYCVVSSQYCGAETSNSATLTVIQNIAVSASTTNISCAGSMDGAIDITVLNGQAPFTFNWSTGATTEDITGLDEGLYTVYITDQNNCRARATIGIGQPYQFGFYHDTTFWASANRGGGPGMDRVRAIATDQQGNTYVTGSFSSNATFGFASLVSFGDEDIFVARYDATGTLLWIRQAGGTLNDYGTGISVDSSGYIYVTGTFQEMAFFGTTLVNANGNHDAFLAKYDPTGNLVWVRNSGGFFNDKATAVQADERGYTYITGSYEGIATFGSQTLISAGGDDIFAAKYNPDGDLEWIRSSGGTSEDFGQAITLDVSRNVIVAGKFQNTAAFGSTNLTASGSTDIFLVKYNTLGTQLWAKRAGGSQTDNATAVKTDYNSNIYVAGSVEGNASFGAINLVSNGGRDLALAKYNPAGNTLWARNVGGSLNDAGKSLAVDALGNAYVAGYFRDQMTLGRKTLLSAGENDVVVVKYNTTGELVWSQQAGGPGADSAMAIALLPGKDLRVGGSFTQTAAFGANSLTSAGQDEAFLALLTQEEVYTAPEVTQVSCFGGNDGAINITPGGGTLPFTYYWSNGMHTEDLANIEEGTYWLFMNDVNGCEKDTTFVLTYQFAPPVAPLSASANEDYICSTYTGNIVLTATGGSGDTLVWYSGSCGGTRVGIDNNLAIAPPTATTTYFALWKNACGESSCVQVTVHVIPDPVKPDYVTASPAVACEGDGLITLTAVGGEGEILKWYTGGCGVTEIGTGTPKNDVPIPTADTWYYGRWESVCSNSACDSVLVVVNPQPVAPTEIQSSVTGPICAGTGGPITLTAVGGSGDVIKWTRDDCNGTVFASGATLTSLLVDPPTVTTTYFAYWTNSCGNSDCASVTIEVIGNPPGPTGITASANNFCENTVPTLTLTAVGGGGGGATLNWYTGACGGLGGTLVGTNNPLVLTGSQVPDVSTIYYAQYENTCGTSLCASTQITVFDVPVVFIQNLNSTYCDNVDPFVISGSVTGEGNFSGDGDGITPLGNGQAIFSPHDAGAGVHHITYSYITGNQCLADTTVEVTVNTTSWVNIIGLADTYCLNDDDVDISGSEQPGYFTEFPGLDDHNNGTATFSPSLAGVGSHQITYTFTNSFGCISDTTRTVFVNNIPTVYFTGLMPQYCEDDQPVTLTGNHQPDGQFSGPVSNIGYGRATFDPSSVSTGVPYDITYIYTNTVTGCSNSQTQQVTVNPVPVVSFTGLDPEYCVNGEQDTLTGDQAPLGEFYGPGIHDNHNGTAYFRPWEAPGGPHTITYTYTDGNGCTGIAEMTTIVRTVQTVNFTGLNTYYCAAEGVTATLIGSQRPFGNFSITPVTPALTDLSNGTATFEPFVAGPGTYEITYSYLDANGCTATRTKTVTVNPLPYVTITNLDTTYCINDPFTIIEGNHQPDGQFTYDGPAGGIVDLGNGKAKFIPSVAGLGTFNITYTYINGNACQNDTTMQTEVVPKPALTISNLATDYCQADAADTITGNYYPLGSFNGQGVLDLGIGKAIFTPGGVTDFDVPIPIHYSLNAPGMCSNDTIYYVTVHSTPVASFTGLQPEYCENAGDVVLIGNHIPGGTFTGPTPGLTDSGLGYAIWSPSAAGPGGPYTIKFTYTDPNGCSDSMIMTTVVNPLPEAPTSLSVNHNDYCLNSVNALTFTATGGSGTILKWFRGACGTNLVGTGTEITVAAPNDTTWYYARWENECGVSECDSIRINVLFQPVAPLTLSVDQNDFCAGSVTDIVLSAEGGQGAELKWYTGSCGGVYVGSGNPFTTPAPAVTTTYFAKWTNICGESGCKSIVVNVVPQPVIADSVTVNHSSFCYGSQSSIILTYHGGVGDVFEWFRGVCSDTLIGTGQNLEVVAPTMTTTYFGRWRNACDSTPCQQVTVTIWPLPVAPDSVTSTENEYCAGTVSTLTLTAHGGSGDEIKWYANECGTGTSIGSGPDLLINAPTVTTKYYARWEGSCGTSECTMKQITVFPLPLPIDSLTVDTNNFCRSYNGIIILNAFGGAGDTLKWYQDACGTEVIGLGSELRMQAPDTNTWYFAKWVSGCGEATCDSIEVKVNIPLPVDTVFVDKPVICFSDAGLIRLTAQGGRGDVLNWYEGTCGGTPIGTGYTLSLPSPTETTTYIARWENSCEVSECDSVTVTVIPQAVAPTLITIDTNNFCQGSVSTVTLTAIGGYGDTITGQGETLRWFFANCEGLEAGTGNPLVIPAPLFTTNYYVRWENSCSASECAHIEVKVNNPEPVVLVEVDTNDFCPGTVTDITLFAHGGYGEQLKWFTKENGTYTNIGTGYPLNIFAPDTTTWYYVRWENICGVSDYDSIRVNVNKPVVPPVLQVDTNNFCSDYGFQIALSGLGGNGDTLRWFEGSCNGPELGTGNPLWIDHPLVTTTYYARYENECGTTGCNSITVTVVPHPELFAGTMDSVCEKADYQVEGATASNYTSVTWTTDGTGYFVDPNVLNPIYRQGTDDVVTRDTVNLIMTVMGNSPCGAYSDTLMLIINPLPVITVNDTNPLICRDSLFTFVANGAFSYHWSPGTGLTDTTGNVVTASPQVTTSYLITGTSPEGCVDSLRVSVTVRTTPYVDLGPDRYLFTCEPVVLDAGASDGVDSYEWQDGSPTRYFKVEENGIYWVTVSNDACAVTDTIIVHLCGGYIWMPSAFSPNADGLNEVFKARSSDETIKFHMYIFSRSGALVFETDDLYEGWDGRDTKGNDCPTGVYIWKIVYRGNGDVSPGIEQTETGSVMLMR